MLLAGGLNGGCATYHAKPLSPAAVEQTLAVPPTERIQMEANSLRHPLLPPIPFDERDGISPDEAAVLAVLVNPDLRAVRDQRALANAQVIEAGLLPNPQLSYGLEFPTGGATLGTVKAFGLGLDWEVTALIAHSALKDSARNAAGAVDLDVAWQEWQVAEAAKAAVYQVLALEGQVALAQEMEKRLQENTDTVAEAVNAGLMTDLNLTAAEAESDQAQAALLELQNQAQEQRFLLNRLLGLPAETYLMLQPDTQLPVHFSAPAGEQLLAGLEDRRLDLVALRRGYQSQESALRAAILNQFPKISLGIIHARDTGEVITTGFGVSIDLPIFDRNQARIAKEKATRQTLFDEYAARIFESRSDVAKLLAGIESLNEQIAVAQAAEPDLERLVESYRIAANASQADVLSYYSAWNSLGQKRLDVLAFQQQLAQARIALEIATGTYRFEPAPSVPAGPRPAEENTAP